MKKLLILLNAVLLVTTNSSLVIGCGAADGPEVEAHFAVSNTPNFKTEDINKTTLDGKNSGEKKYPYQYLGMNGQLVWPALTSINLKEDSKGTGPKFNESLYDSSLQGQQKTLEASKDGKAWSDFFKVWSGSDDTYFTNVDVNASLNDKNEEQADNVPSSPTNPTAFLPLAVTALPKDTVNEDYYNKTKGGLPGEGDYSINKAYDNLVVPAAVYTSLGALNSFSPPKPPFSQKYITKDQLNNNKSNDKVTQDARHALVDLGPINFVFHFKGPNHTYLFDAKLQNLVAHLELKDYQVNKKDTYQAWMLAGYDFWSSASITNLGTQAYQKISIPGTTSNLYIGFYDGDKTKTPTDAAKGSTDKGEFDTKTTSKTGINYPELKVTLSEKIQES